VFLVVAVAVVVVVPSLVGTIRERKAWHMTDVTDCGQFQARAWVNTYTF
jgi:hypothetical protein